MIMDYDHVYGPNCTQKEIFEDTEPTMMSVTDGYNVCIMAYGQTGSGKTHTMLGPPSDPGVNRRAIAKLFEICKQKSEMEFSIKVSLMEVYNENLYDLLDGNRNKLNIRQAANGVAFAEGLVERLITTPEQVTEVLADGDKNRTVAATKMNSNSSRSHSIMQITVSSFNTISKVTTQAKLTLVDLAGSERVAKTDASGERLVEAAAINKSLSALGQVFQAIATNSPHVPYRNSKLTHVLQDSLGGNSKTCMFVNLSPLEPNISETHSSLLFGKNIRTIELGPATKKVTSPTSLPPPPGRK